MYAGYASNTPDSQRAPRYRNQGGYYIPPRTPSSASAARVGASSALPTSASHSRKRSRADDFDRASRSSLPLATSTNRKRAHGGRISTSRASSDRTASPPPFVNTKYCLAGGLDTPTAGRESAFDNWQNDTEDDFRRRWSNSNVRSDYDSSGRQTVTLDGLQRGGNGRKRSRSSMETPTRSSTESWGQYVYDIVGGIWNFCRNNAFGGFSAGGGATYDMKSGRPQRLNSEDSWSTINEQAGNGHDQDRFSHRRIPIPGEFPQDDDIDLIDYHEAAGEIEPRPAKRRQTTQGNDWVMVDHSDKLTGSAANASNKSRPPRISPTGRSTASRRSRLSSGRVPSVSHAGSPFLAKDRAASSASPRSSSQFRENSSPQSSQSPEIQKFEARRRREEKKSDASIKKMSQQLNALINEGKKALETKVEVDDDDITNGYAAGPRRDSVKAYGSGSRRW